MTELLNNGTNLANANLDASLIVSNLEKFSKVINTT